MINLKIIKNFFYSRIFLISFGFFVAFSSISYISYSIYKYVQKRQDQEAFLVLYDILERCQGAINSNSSIPMEEIADDLEKAYQDVGFICSLKKDFLFANAGALLAADKTEKGISLLKEMITYEPKSELDFLYGLLYAISLAVSKDMNTKQEGIALLKKYTMQSYMKDVALFYYGYFLLKTTSLRQADEAWYPLLHDPLFNNSHYKELIVKARNWDY